MFAKDITDGTPLMYAAAGDLTDAMTLLFDKGQYTKVIAVFCDYTLWRLFVFGLGSF